MDEMRRAWMASTQTPASALQHTGVIAAVRVLLWQKAVRKITGQCQILGS